MLSCETGRKLISFPEPPVFSAPLYFLSNEILLCIHLHFQSFSIVYVTRTFMLCYLNVTSAPGRLFFCLILLLPQIWCFVSVVSNQHCSEIKCCIIEEKRVNTEKCPKDASFVWSEETHHSCWWEENFLVFSASQISLGFASGPSLSLVRLSQEIWITPTILLSLRQASLLPSGTDHQWTHKNWNLISETLQQQQLSNFIKPGTRTIPFSANKSSLKTGKGH